MLAPKELVATGPSTPRAAAVKRVVVVLPLVPDTSAMARPAARCASRSGSIFRPIQPPMTEPSPRPAARDSAAAVRDTELATLARRGILGSVTRGEGTDRTSRAGSGTCGLAAVPPVTAGSRLCVCSASLVLLHRP